VKEKLRTLELELELAQEEVEARGVTMEVRDSNMTTLQKQSHGVVDKLKTAWANIEARDSTIAKLRHQLTTEQSRMKTYQEHTPLLETKVSALEAEVKRLTQSLDEKNSALTTSRKHLKNSRDRNMELEKVAERAGQTEDKFKGAESEIRTLKGLLTSKTAMVERRKKELAETRARLVELEERDSRRAVILADVLERTARQYQQTLGVGGVRGVAATMNLDPQLSLSSSQNPDLAAARRPVSAPSVPPDMAPHSPTSPHLHTLTPGTSPHAHPPPHIVRTYTIPGVAVGAGSSGGRLAPGVRGAKTTRRLQLTSHMTPKLPPIRRRGKSLPSTSFHMPTAVELRELQRCRDKTEMVQHSEANPRCACQLCTAGGATAESVEDGYRLEETVALAGLAGSGERSLAAQIRQGQRILVSMKRSEFDLAPQKYTGIVKYVGKIDSEFIDNRVYVGVKLDEPVGDTDGLVRGKRYFTCPAKHGKVVRLSNVVAILPGRSVSYKPLQSTKRSPYSTSAPSTHRRARVKVT
jgi:HAMP domain-containing protein